MPLGTTETDQLPTNRLLILCPEGMAQSVRVAVSRLSHRDWEATRRITVAPINKGDYDQASFNMLRINRHARAAAGALNVLAIKPVIFDTDGLDEAVGTRRTAETLGGLIKRFLPYASRQVCKSVKGVILRMCPSNHRIVELSHRDQGQ